MTEQELQQLVHETYAAHYVLLNMGFSSDDIYAGVGKVACHEQATVPMPLGDRLAPVLYATVELHAQGLDFVYTLRALAPGDDERFMRVWTEFALAQPKADRRQLDAIVQGSDVWKSKGALLGALTDKGFLFPEVEGPPVVHGRGRDGN